MFKLIVNVLFIGLSLLVVSNGSPLSSESIESNEIIEVEKLMGEIREQCVKNTGSDSVFDFEFMISFQQAMMCVTHFDAQNFETDVSQLTNATRARFFPKYCQEVRSVISCVNDTLSGMQLCLKEDTVQIVEALIDSLPEALDLACKNDGEIIMQLKDQDRKECILQKDDKSPRCVDMLTNGIDNVFDFFKLKLDRCSTLTSFRECTNEKLEPCDLSDIVSIFDIPINAVLPLTPCGNHTIATNVNLIGNNSIDEN